MDVSVEVHKIIKCTIHSTVVVVFTLGGGVDDVLVRLLLFEQIINDANLMSISFSVKHPQAFWESQMSLSNITRIISHLTRNCKSG